MYIASRNGFKLTIGKEIDSLRMKKLIIFMYFMNFYALSRESQKSIDQIMGERYRFDLFENFEECANVYRIEAKVVDKLSQEREKLTTMRIILRKLLIDIKENYKEKLLKIADMIMVKGKQDFHEFYDNLASLANSFPTKMDREGAVKAMLMLHYTYQLNLTLAVTDGILSYSNVLNGPEEFAVRIDIQEFV